MGVNYPHQTGSRFTIGMEADLFAKLTRLKKIVGQMSISDKLAYVAQIKSHLSPEMLKTSDGTHTFSEENILSVGLGAAVTQNRNEFEHIVGFYGGGYKSEIRRGMYHGKGEIPSQTWQREMRRLYYMIKQHAGDVPLPELQDFQPKVHLELVQEDYSEEDLVPADAWQMSRY
jgi:hypothetical protein